MVWAAVTVTGWAATWLIATLTQGEPTRSGLDDVKTIVDIVGTIITAVGVALGAYWAYFRLGGPRVGVLTGGEWLIVGRQRLLRAHVQVHNDRPPVGRPARVELMQRGTGLRVSYLADPDADPDAEGVVTWMPGGVYTVLEEHAWIDPDESVSDEFLLNLPVGEGQPVLFEIRLVMRSRRRRNIVAFARQVLPADATLGSRAGESSASEGDR
jgi:hypothetical protein